MSMRGAWPVTVIDSASLPSSMVTFRESVCSRDTLMPSRTRVWKPSRVYVIL